MKYPVHGQGLSKCRRSTLSADQPGFVRYTHPAPSVHTQHRWFCVQFSTSSSVAGRSYRISGQNGMAGRRLGPALSRAPTSSCRSASTTGQHRPLRTCALHERRAMAWPSQVGTAKASAVMLERECNKNRYSAVIACKPCYGAGILHIPVGA